MPALAISDHGNMFGVFDFVREAYRHTGPDGMPLVKPVVGCEFYITQDRTRKTFSKEERDPRHHQILLAKNAQGYKNLVKLTSLGYTEGMYSKYPRIDKTLIHKYHEGLIATTCCLGALVPQTILKKGEEEGENEFKWWLNIFQEDYYVELQRHGMPEQDRVNQILLKFAKKYNVKVIASNDSHYTDQKDFNAHDILLCINTGELQSTPALREFSDDDVLTRGKRFAFYNDQFYLKTTSEMSAVFSDLPEAIDNTNEIVGKIDTLKLERDILLPHFVVPPGFQTQDDYLSHLTWAGAKRRYEIFTPQIEERINFELSIIREMGFAGYFLIVSDFIKAGRDLGVFIGPGRGSAAGSVVAYCIGITNIDPIKYDLLFERFLNPERKSMPDIDTDFDDVNRQKVIDYVVQKYGKNQVAQIITYGTMAARSAISDVARVLDYPLAESRSLTKLVPEKPGIKLKRLLHAPVYKKDAPGKEETTLEAKEALSPEEISGVLTLREKYNGDDLAARVLKEAEVLEGSVRSTGVHASAIIIAPQDITDILPVATSKESDLWVTQIEGNSIEAAGVIKMDFLGLKTLSILKTSLELIKQNHSVEIDLDKLPLDDAETYKLFHAGETNSIFQFESAGMQKALRDLKPDKFDELIAMNALFRPGPLAYIPKFIARKHGREPVEYDLEEMKEFLENTYGITVYQEQVMLLSQKIAGFSKGQADTLRKAIGKKDRETLDKMKSDFLSGAIERGFPEEKLEKIWTDWEAFAQYAFNKSHATCYALVAYQTAYLKTHYPAEFMAAVLNHAGSADKITFTLEECKRMGLTVLGPDINESNNGFTVNQRGEIRFGLGGIKGVGEAAIENIVETRQKKGVFKNIFDLVKRVNLRSVNKKSMECLASSGAFDTFTDMHRAQFFFAPPGETATALEKIMKYGAIVQNQSASQANTLFGDMPAMEVPPPKIPDCEPWHLMEKLKHEKDVVGFFLSGHPLDNFRFELSHYQFTPLDVFNEVRKNATAQNFPQKTFRIAGLVTAAQNRLTKTGKPFSILTIEDYIGNTEFAFFGEDHVRFSAYQTPGTIVMMEGHFKTWFNSDKLDFKVLKMNLLDTVKSQETKQLQLALSSAVVSTDFVEFICQNAKNNPGKTAVKFHITDVTGAYTIDLSTFIDGITMNDELTSYLLQNPDINVNVQLN